MKQIIERYTCDVCRQEFKPDELINSKTINTYLQRGMATFTRKYLWRDIGGDHIGEELVYLCATCAEEVERVMTGTRQDDGS